MTAAGCCMSSIPATYHPSPRSHSLYSQCALYLHVLLFILCLCVFVRWTFQSTLEWKLKKIKARIMWLAMGVGATSCSLRLRFARAKQWEERADRVWGCGLCLSGNGCATLKWHKLYAICGDVAHHETIHDRYTPPHESAYVCVLLLHRCLCVCESTVTCAGKARIVATCCRCQRGKVEGKITAILWQQDWELEAKAESIKRTGRIGKIGNVLASTGMCFIYEAKRVRKLN